LDCREELAKEGDKAPDGLVTPDAGSGGVLRTGHSSSALFSLWLVSFWLYFASGVDKNLPMFFKFSFRFPVALSVGVCIGLDCREELAKDSALFSLWLVSFWLYFASGVDTSL
jgi:hypothetical protein